MFAIPNQCKISDNNNLEEKSETSHFLKSGMLVFGICYKGNALMAASSN